MSTVIQKSTISKKHEEPLSRDRFQLACRPLLTLIQSFRDVIGCCLVLAIGSKSPSEFGEGLGETEDAVAICFVVEKR